MKDFVTFYCCQTEKMINKIVLLYKRTTLWTISMLTQMSPMQHLTPMTHLSPMQHLTQIPRLVRNMSTTNLHESPYMLITSRIDEPRVYIPYKPTVQVSKVKDISRFDLIQARAGIIVYTIVDGKIYFCMGKDSEYDSYTDFAGGVRYSVENVISAAVREFNEESLQVFGDIEPEKIQESICLYSNSMLTIFLNVRCDLSDIINNFQKKVRYEDQPEIKEINWLSRTQFFRIVRI